MTTDRTPATEAAFADVIASSGVGTALGRQFVWDNAVKGHAFTLAAEIAAIEQQAGDARVAALVEELKDIGRWEQSNGIRVADADALDEVLARLASEAPR